MLFRLGPYRATAYTGCQIVCETITLFTHESACIGYQICSYENTCIHIVWLCVGLLGFHREEKATNILGLYFS